MNACAPTEEKSDDSKDSFYEELEQVFDHFPTYYTKIMSGDFNAKLGREEIFKLTIRNESLHGVRTVKFCHIKKSSCYEHDVPAPKLS